MMMTESHQEEGETLQTELRSFETSLLKAVAKIWPDSDLHDQAQPDIERPKRPSIEPNPDDWFMTLLETR